MLHLPTGVSTGTSFYESLADTLEIPTPHGALADGAELITLPEQCLGTVTACLLAGKICGVAANAERTEVMLTSRPRATPGARHLGIWRDAQKDLVTKRKMVAGRGQVQKPASCARGAAESGVSLRASTRRRGARGVGIRARRKRRTAEVQAQENEFLGDMRSFAPWMRRALGISVREIRRLRRHETFAAFARAAQMSFFGHLVRVSCGRISKMALTWGFTPNSANCELAKFGSLDRRHTPGPTSDVVSSARRLVRDIRAGEVAIVAQSRDIWSAPTSEVRALFMISATDSLGGRPRPDFAESRDFTAASRGAVSYWTSKCGVSSKLDSVRGLVKQVKRMDRVGELAGPTPCWVLLWDARSGPPPTFFPHDSVSEALPMKKWMCVENACDLPEEVEEGSCFVRPRGRRSAELATAEIRLSKEAWVAPESLLSSFPAPDLDSAEVAELREKTEAGSLTEFPMAREIQTLLAAPRSNTNRHGAQDGSKDSHSAPLERALECGDTLETRALPSGEPVCVCECSVCSQTKLDQRICGDADDGEGYDDDGPSETDEVTSDNGKNAMCCQEKWNSSLISRPESDDRGRFSRSTKRLIHHRFRAETIGSINLFSAELQLPRVSRSKQRGKEKKTRDKNPDKVGDAEDPRHAEESENTEAPGGMARDPQLLHNITWQRKPGGDTRRKPQILLSPVLSHPPLGTERFS